MAPLASGDQGEPKTFLKDAELGPDLLYDGSSVLQTSIPDVISRLELVFSLDKESIFCHSLFVERFYVSRINSEMSE